jgi:DNA primase
MGGNFLDSLVEQWAIKRTLDDEEYLAGRGASESQIDALNVGTVRGKFDRPSGDGRRFARWSHGLKRIQGHVSFPLHNQLGQVAGLLVRDPVEKDYSKWTLTDAKSSAYFFGLPAAIQAIWETRVAWVVEGPFDWFVLQRLFPNTLATTTDALTWQQCVFIRRYVRKVMFALDMDEAGREGIEVSRGRLGSDVETRAVAYPFKDPGEFWERRGETVFNRHFTRAARAA